MSQILTCFCHDKILIISFANISDDLIQCNFICFYCCFFRSQWLWMFTCLSRIKNFTFFFFIKRMICLLSQLMIIEFNRSNLMVLNKKFKFIAFLVVLKRNSNSISMLNVIIVVCLQIFQVTGFSYNFITYFWKLFWSKLFAKNAFIAYKHFYFFYSLLYWIVNDFVAYQYFKTRNFA